MKNFALCQKTFVFAAKLKSTETHWFEFYCLSLSSYQHNLFILWMILASSNEALISSLYFQQTSGIFLLIRGLGTFRRDSAFSINFSSHFLVWLYLRYNFYFCCERMNKHCHSNNYMGFLVPVSVWERGWANIFGYTKNISNKSPTDSRVSAFFQRIWLFFPEMSYSLKNNSKGAVLNILCFDFILIRQKSTLCKRY